MADITVNLWQDFNFDTLTPENLAANDHTSVGSWSIVDLNSRLSMSASAEMTFEGKINGITDVSGTRGMRYESPIDFDPGRIVYQFSTRKSTVSAGVAFKFPTEYVGSFEGGQPDLLVIRNILGTNELYVKLVDNNGGRFHLFTVESNYSDAILVEPETWYWITVTYGPDLHKLRVYDMSTGDQVGEEQTLPGAGAVNEEAATVILGSLIGDTGGGGPFDFDDLVLDWTDASFPLGPPVGLPPVTGRTTLLDITNQVLRRLREEQVTDLDDEYPALVASFVADVVAELNEATIWNFLDHEVEVSLVDGTNSYPLLGTNNNSHLLWNATGPACWLFDSQLASAGTQLTYLDPSDFYSLYQGNRDLSGTPAHFTVEKDTDNADLYIRFWPTPNASKYVRVRMNTPEPELDPAEDAATIIYMPDRVVRLGALAMAMNERGEEIGEPGNILERRYEAARGAAIENEIRARERSGFYDWSRN